MGRIRRRDLLSAAPTRGLALVLARWLSRPLSRLLPSGIKCGGMLEEASARAPFFGSDGIRSGPAGRCGSAPRRQMRQQVGIRAREASFSPCVATRNHPGQLRRVRSRAQPDGVFGPFERCSAEPQTHEHTACQHERCGASSASRPVPRRALGPGRRGQMPRAPRRSQRGRGRFNL